MAFRRTFWLLGLIVSASCSLIAQKQIDYQSDWGERRPSFPNQLILRSNVIFFHDGMTMHCDSAVLHTEDDFVEAFGNIHCYQDTTHLYGDKVQYDGNTKIAEIFGKVVTLQDGATTLQTDCLVWDREAETVRYTTGADIWDEENTLRSEEGTYFVGEKLFEFTDKVRISSQKADIISDFVAYETQTDIAFFQSPTEITTSDSIFIKTSLGEFNTRTNQALLLRDNFVKQKAQSLKADSIDYNTETECGVAVGNVRIEDTANAVIILSQYLETDRKDSIKYAFLTNGLHLRQMDEGDTLHLHADTLWVDFDSLDKAEKIRVYRHVKFYRSDIQGICEVGIYNLKDSLAFMLERPALWQDESQFTADTIEIRIAKKGIRSMQLYPNPFIVQNSDTASALYYNQISGRRMRADFSNRRIAYAQMDNNVNLIYYVWEEKNGKPKQLTGVNIGTCASLKMYFERGRLKKMTAVSQPDFFLDDVERVSEKERTLKGFISLEKQRPHSLNDIFIHRN